MSRQRFQATVEVGERGRVFITLPFDPRQVWGPSRRFYVRGTLAGNSFSASLGARGGRFFMPLNKDLQDRTGAAVGKVIHVQMEPERAEEPELPGDIAAALKGSPAAMALFDGLTPFYRNQWIAWITEAKRKDTRAGRLREAMEQLAAGIKQRS
jgi:hypothetical protein